MILHLTLNDNDFTEMLESFAKTIARTSFNASVPNDYAECAECIKNEVIMGHIGKCAFQDITPEQRKEYLAIIQKSWRNYIAGKKDEKYLKSGLHAKIIKAMPDTWDNGESVYVIPASYSNCIVTL